MGRLIVEQIVTADGFAADADGGMKFMAPPPDDRVADSGPDREQLALLEHVEAIVIGATTYRMFADYWPTASVEQDPVAGIINALPKHVVSNELERAPWGEGEINVERGDGVEVLERLTTQYTGDVIVWGSLTLTDALFTAGVVDVLRLRVVPRLIGAGRGVTPATLAMTDLDLTSTHAHPGGQVTLQYAVRRPVSR